MRASIYQLHAPATCNATVNKIKTIPERESEREREREREITVSGRL
jgi:hypothetical protein